MKLKSVSTYCQSAMSAGLIYTRDENGEIIRQHLVCRQMIVPLDGMPVISGDQLPALLDVPEERRDAWFVSRIERDEGTGKELSWMLEDRQPGDIPAILLPMTLAVNDVIVQPVMDEACVAMSGNSFGYLTEWAVKKAAHSAPRMRARPAFPPCNSD